MFDNFFNENYNSFFFRFLFFVKNDNHNREQIVLPSISSITSHNVNFVNAYVSIYIHSFLTSQLCWHSKNLTINCIS